MPRGSSGGGTSERTHREVRRRDPDRVPRGRPSGDLQTLEPRRAPVAECPDPLPFPPLLMLDRQIRISGFVVALR